MDLEKIKEVIELMNDHQLTEFSYEEHNKYKLSLKQGCDMPTVIAAGAPVATAAAAVENVAAVASDEKIIESPLVGTFYTAASPEAPIYASVGDEVTEDSIICIVEAMKVMNEITAGFNGTIKEILVNNAEPVEYGQPLFKIKLK
jgi:acetyl-CoA carboxylase biotin carboxyl carrier protein